VPDFHWQSQNLKTGGTVMNTKLAYALSVALMASISLPAAFAGDRTAGEVVDDMSIAAQTKTKLAADPVTDAIKIDVEVDESHVQLNGFVDSMQERTHAEEIVRSIDGVASVDNNLQLQPRDRTAGEYVDDKVLVADVKAALAEDPVAKALEIDIEADQGVISLGGHVGSAAEREAAYKAAIQVAGVVRVINNLDVRS
jgi:hyperosmotically inducible protein